MALTFIRSSSDKQKWQKAVELTKERRQLRDPNNPNYDSTLAPIENVFAYANWLYHNVLRESGSVVLEEKEVPGLVQSEAQQKLWDWVEKNVFEDSTLTELEETKKWEVTEDLYKEFVSKVPSDMPMDKLEEFVNLQGGYSGASNKGALFGMGGSRDERPVGPIVYGSQNVGLSPMVNPYSTDGEPAQVITPEKHDQYDPNAFKIDSLGNVTNDVKSSVGAEQNQTEEDITPELFDTLQELGYTPEQLETLDDEDLQNVIKKALKHQNKAAETTKLAEAVSIGKTIKQKLNEAFLSEEDLLEKVTATSAARELLAHKHKIAKANKKKDDTFILKQDEISKLIRQYGYTWNRKNRKWIRKFSPTFLARKLLSTKFQDAETIKKDENGKYVQTQEDIIKKIKSKGFVWDTIKKTWVKKEVASVEPTQVKQEPEETIQEPKPIATTTPAISADIIAPQVVEPKETEPEIDDDEWEDSDVELNPFVDPTVLNKIKIMQARLILGAVHSKPENTQFDTVENNIVPKVKDEEVLEKIQQLGYSWDITKKLWLDQAMAIPSKMFNLGETKQSIIARSYLAAIDKVKYIKTSDNGDITSSPDHLDAAMDSEGFIWDPQTQIWKYLGDQEDTSEVDVASLINEDVEYVEIVRENLKSPKKKYSLLDVAEVQARTLMRALQYAWYRKYFSKDPAKAKQIWDNQMADGKDDDPFNGKMDISIIEDYLNTKMSYEFNEDEDKPMWTESGKRNRLPPVLNEVGINSEQEYIARGILGSKDENWAKIRASNPAKPQMSIPDKKVSMKMKDNGYGWNDEWGWVVADPNQEVTSKAELSKQNWLKDKQALPFDQLAKDEKRKIKEYAGYRVAAKLINKSPQEWDKLTAKERKTAMMELEKHYSFDNKKKTWIEREQPISSGFWNRLGKIAGGLLAGGAWARNKIKKFADPNDVSGLSGIAKNLGRYN